MAYRFPTQDELSPTPEELDAAKKAQAAQADTGTGATIGSVLGTIAGLAPLLAGPAGVPFLAATIPAGASIGGGIGSAIGGSVGGAETAKDNAIVNADEMERNKKLAALKIRQEAIDRLESA